MTNADLAHQLFKALKKLSVREIIVCAGARNFPIVHHLEKQSFEVTSYFEERSASFYALGRIKASSRPVAIVVTSGTAVSELYSAVIESYYQGQPLIVITADRPKHFRGSGSPQTIDQVGLFRGYVSDCLDWDYQTTDFTINYQSYRPLHINLCFDEPLKDEVTYFDSEINIVSHKQQKPMWPSEQVIENPLLIVSDIPASFRDSVEIFINQNKVFSYFEFLSGLTATDQIKDYVITEEGELDQLIQSKKIKSIIRVGGVPTARVWRDLEKKYAVLPIYHFSEGEFAGHSTQRTIYDLESVLKTKIQLTDYSRTLNNKLVSVQKIIRDYPMSEQAWMGRIKESALSKNIYLGNSLPIRMWDFVSGSQPHDINPYANRGANGIDGQISTYLGWAKSFEESWCLLGDLTTMYDLAALGLAAENNNKLRIVIMNNSGGQIFNRIFGNEKFLNHQNVQFKYWAQMWGWNYLSVSQLSDLDILKKHPEKKLIVEVFIDKNQTQSVWAEYDKRWKE